MAVPGCPYGSEMDEAKDKCHLQATEMRFLRSTSEVTRTDKLRNQQIRQKLGIYNINEKADKYKNKMIITYTMYA
jgi:hypothetical protein